MKNELENNKYIGGFNKALKYYVSSKDSGVSDGLTTREKENPIKPIINKSLKKSTVFGMSPLAFLGVSFSLIAICGVAIITIKNK